MTTCETAEHLAAAARNFPELLGDIGARDLIELVRCELGHPEILDDFQSYAGHRAMAFGPRVILHVLSGNTPHAGLQSLLRGLQLKSHNFCKIPSGGLPEIAQFRDALPEPLRSRIEISSDLPGDWMDRADAVIVFGNDETVEQCRLMSRANQRFVGHGHRVSFGVVLDDPGCESAPFAARDASLFDQRGCLSPQAFYVRETGALTARAYAEALAREMEVFNRHTPRGAITPAEAAAIENFRGSYEFLAANDPHVRVWKSEGSTAWTVICLRDAGFLASCLNRVVFVQPLPDDPAPALAQVRPWLGTIGVWPATEENCRAMSHLGATRVCVIGRMQSPPLAWHHDGWQTLAPLVHWVDIEPAR